VCLALSLSLTATADAQVGAPPQKKDAGAEVEDEAAGEADTAAGENEPEAANNGETEAIAGDAGTGEDEAAAVEDVTEAPADQPKAGPGGATSPGAATEGQEEPPETPKAAHGARDSPRSGNEGSPKADGSPPGTEEDSVGVPKASNGAEAGEKPAAAAEEATAQDSGPPPPEGAGEDEAGTPTARPALQVGAFSSDFRFDGRLDDPAWNAADSIGDLITVEPKEGGVPAGQTTVKVLTSPREIIIGVLCRDRNPAGIVTFSKARDADLSQEDHVLIVLDPFQDRRSGYVFGVNPSGARFDGLVSAQGEEVNSNWDAVWEAKTSRDSRGWSAELRIPIKSLSFKKGLSAWGLNVQRRVQRLQETSRWSGASQDHEIYQTSQAGSLTALPPFDYGWGLSIRPAFVADASRSGPDVGREYSGDLSLDLSKKLGPNLVASATVNTDFAETEVDARQTNLTRFDLFFPEKRTFFLEGSDIFEFGLGIDEEIMVPFFTRRIGLFGGEDDLLQVPLNVGGKVNGRMGNTNVAALAVLTGRVDRLGTPGATMGAVRIKQNVLTESSIGMLATFGDPLGRTGSWMAGLDATYQASDFLGDKNFLVGVWGLGNGREDLRGDQFAYGGQIAYPNDLVDLGAKYIRIGDGFQPSLGFVSRTGHILEISSEISPRPRWSFLRQMVHEASYFAVIDRDGKVESHRFTIKPLDWLFESGDRIEFLVEPEGERLTEPFDIADDVLIPPGSYRWNRYSVGGTLAEKRRISGGAAASFGRFFEGHLSTIEFALAVKPWPMLALELAGERNRVRLPQGNFTEKLYSGRIEFRYSSDFQVSSLLQYDTESREFGSNTRVRWTFHPLGDLFVVFNHNLKRSLDDRFTFDSNRLLVKLQYALRI
jgi:hypothetical protein